jgi:hypothetical protein
VPLPRTLRMWNADQRRQGVPPGRWSLRVAQSSHRVARRLPVRVTGSLPRAIATVSLAPPKLELKQGETLDLRGTNPWLDGLAPPEVQDQGHSIISLVRGDDSFAGLGEVPLRFESDSPGVVSVDSDGRLTASAPGTATITVRAGDASASAPFVVTGP